MDVRALWLYALGPRLYKVHWSGPAERLHELNLVGQLSDRVLASVAMAWRLGMWGSPLVALYLYRKDSNFSCLLSTVMSVGLVVGASLALRTCARIADPDYRRLVAALRSNDVSALRAFEFDFDAWPVTYDASRAPTPAPNVTKATVPPSDAFVKLLGWFAVHTFGIRLIYPGSTALLRLLVGDALLRGRIKLVEEHRAQRHKLQTRDVNLLDCVFIDRRGLSPEGDTLVIASEGNAGFYEIGIVTTPVEAGYSVLGYNRPGFGDSTGRPYPDQERAAVDAVMAFAADGLGFAPDNTVLFGWSIGCYAMAWAAVNNPKVRGAVFDATFDDLLPLALARMPPSWAPLVTQVVREHVDLNVAETIAAYPGPVRLVRRTSDEIIALRPGNVSTNRANDLLVKLLTRRHPDVVGPEQREVLRKYLGVRGATPSSFLATGRVGDPDKNRRTLQLAERYMIDYDSTHCTPLPPAFFHVPTESNDDEDFVFT